MKKQRSESNIIFDGTVFISENIHAEYIAYSNTIDIDSYDYKSVLKKSITILFDSQTPLEIKKKLIYLLGQFATVECYKILKKYIDTSNESLVPWATLSMQDLRFKVENDMHDDSRDMVMSPSGGKGDKIRFYTAFSSKNGISITGIQKQTIKKQLLTCMKQYHVEVENISFGNNYCLTTLLIPLTVAPQTPIDMFLDNVSTTKHILRYHFMLTNVQPFTQNEIDDYLTSKELIDLDEKGESHFANL